MLFGHFGDRIGRKKTLVIALVMMAIASTLIGLLPTYATIGLAAPILLSLLRFAQGLAIGGQWGGAMLLVTESAPADQRVTTVPMRRPAHRSVSFSLILPLSRSALPFRKSFS